MMVIKELIEVSGANSDNMQQGSNQGYGNEQSSNYGGFNQNQQSFGGQQQPPQQQQQSGGGGGWADQAQSFMNQYSQNQNQGQYGGGQGQGQFGVTGGQQYNAPHGSGGAGDFVSGGPQSMSSILPPLF